MIQFDHIEIHVKNSYNYVLFLKKLFPISRFKKISDNHTYMFLTGDGIRFEIKENISFEHTFDINTHVGFCLPCLHVPFTKQITYKREQTEVVRMKYDFLQTHTARRSFCSNEYLKGTDPMIIMAISGHKSHKSFMRYIKVSNEQFADKMAKIWEEREIAGV